MFHVKFLCSVQRRWSMSWFSYFQNLKQTGTELKTDVAQRRLGTDRHMVPLWASEGAIFPSEGLFNRQLSYSQSPRPPDPLTPERKFLPDPIPGSEFPRQDEIILLGLACFKKPLGRENGPFWGPQGDHVSVCPKSPLGHVCFKFCACLF